MTHHLVVGAGPIGSATARRLADSGERVVLVSRSGRGPEHPGIERRSLDAADVAQLLDAVPRRDGPLQLREPRLPPVAHGLAAHRRGSAHRRRAHRRRARDRVEPVRVRPVDGPLTEDLPLAATGRKGRVRARMYADALAAHEAGRLRMTEVRASDYVGPGAQSHLGDRVVPRLLAGRGVSVLGDPDQPHSWTYTDDVARMLVTAARDERAWGRAWHVPSNPARTQREAIADMARVAGTDMVSVRALPRVLLRTLGTGEPGHARAAGDAATSSSTRS